MIKLILASLTFTTAATQAFGLSCMRPDTVRAFQEASASEQTYFVVQGSFDFAEGHAATGNAAKDFDATFSGRLLTRTGFTQQVDFPLTVSTTCAGDWCGKLELGTKYVAFVERVENQNFVLKVDACSSLAIRNPELDAIKRLENCAQGGACEPGPVTR